MAIDNNCCSCSAGNHVSTHTNIRTTDWNKPETMGLVGNWSAHHTEKLKHHLTLGSTGIITITVTSTQGVAICSDTVTITTIAPPSSSAPRQASSKNKVFKVLFRCPKDKVAYIEEIQWNFNNSIQAQLFAAETHAAFNKTMLVSLNSQLQQRTELQGQLARTYSLPSNSKCIE